MGEEFPWVEIPGLAEWMQKQITEEEDRRHAFTKAVKKDKGLRCATCGGELSVRMKGIMTPEGRLKCGKCRVGVYA